MTDEHDPLRHVFNNFELIVVLEMQYKKQAYTVSITFS